MWMLLERITKIYLRAWRACAQQLVWRQTKGADAGRPKARVKLQSAADSRHELQRVPGISVVCGRRQTNETAGLVVVLLACGRAQRKPWHAMRALDWTGRATPCMAVLLSSPARAFPDCFHSSWRKTTQTTMAAMKNPDCSPRPFRIATYCRKLLFDRRIISGLSAVIS